MPTERAFPLYGVHPSWISWLQHSLASMDPDYIQSLQDSAHWLPGIQKIFHAFSLPVEQVQYILLGESPYPRAASANGYAFWDASITELWSPSGFSKPVNRATSFRNILKMLLVAEQALAPHHTSQQHIAALNKDSFIQTNQELFQHLLERGFLLLNASLVLQHQAAQRDAQAWRPFMQNIFTCFLTDRPHTTVILWGQLARIIPSMLAGAVSSRTHIIQTEHPYNCSFIQNAQMLALFQPMHLLLKKR